MSTINLVPILIVAFSWFLLGCVVGAHVALRRTDTNARRAGLWWNASRGRHGS
jgi:hypothetical protein